MEENNIFNMHEKSGAHANFIQGYEEFNLPASYCSTPEYPVTDYFIEKYKMYPSISMDTTFCKRKDMEAAISRLNEKGLMVIKHSSHDRKGDDTYDYGIYFAMVIKEDKLVYITKDYWSDAYNAQYPKESYEKYVIRVFHLPHVDSQAVTKDVFPFLGIKKRYWKPSRTHLGHIHVLVSGQNGFDLISNTIKQPEIDFELNYNTDFQEVAKEIVKKIQADKEKALFLFNGPPGGGKTTFIRWLCHQTSKKVIFIPPGFTNALTDPSFIKFLLNQSNSILVIEDAETALQKRDGSAAGNQAVSNLLNLTDGLLSDIANIQIICTFNTELKNIDEALLREGRLTKQYKFDKLEESRARKLADKIGKPFSGQGSLSAIYNQEDNGSKKKGDSPIGFKS